ncbi:hypothetical protein SELMODRAFT_137150 [Selaginella moellendorffii]|uniref:Intraflagellar transport protein 56 n=1 Tax=Selaginella moellendorffii TaxID=88036 RepID=D8TD01_SELML|nr:hypothetical protein SELMODRAFT_137150 [Selaginella moellendorffii]
MLVSKARRSVSAYGDRATSAHGSNKDVSAVPDLLEMVESRNYSGALALLQFKHQADMSDVKTLEWLGFCYFHNGDYNRALETYKKLEPLDEIYYIYQAACLYYLDSYREAEESALKGATCGIRNRLLFHVAYRLDNDMKLVEHHSNIGNSDEDQLSLASMHFAQIHYEEATEIYKQLLLENKDWMALNVYLALCYYNLDQYDVSLDVLSGYLQYYPESAIATNLKACNTFQLFNGKAAELVLTTPEETAKNSLEQGLFKHNLVVFRNGEGALQVLPSLLDVLHEARLNLVIYYIKIGDTELAYQTVKMHEPHMPQEYVVKAVTCASLGQDTDHVELLSMARQYFHLIGTSPTECDTILGRQCMASYYILQKQFKDALIYLQSIKSFCENQDEFNWNSGIVKASIGDFREAEENLLFIQNTKYLENYYYVAWLLYCLIMNGKANIAWEHFLRLEASDETFSFLQLIANECYKTCQYLYAAKAFDAIEEMDESMDCWEGKRGACLGVLQKVISGEEPCESIKQVFALLENTNNPEVEFLLKVMQDYLKEISLQSTTFAFLSTSSSKPMSDEF